MIDTINRDDVRSLVEVFYQPPFKTFYVNSIDGREFTKPVGIFVSLGITTSLKTIDNICDIINNSEKYSAKVVEIASKRISGQFLNYVTTENPEQIHIDTIQQGVLFLNDRDKGEKLIDQKFSKIELEHMKDLMHPDQDISTLQTYAPKIKSLESLISQIENDPEGWNGYWILKRADGSYKLFHRYINYSNMGDVEYRVGIFVTLK